MADQLNVEVVYAEASRQFVRRLSVPVGSTVMQVIAASGIREAIPGLVIDPTHLGIFSRKATPEQQVGEGDRVEIYRPLTLDPKEARRRRAHEG